MAAVAAVMAAGVAWTKLVRPLLYPPGKAVGKLAVVKPAADEPPDDVASANAVESPVVASPAQSAASKPKPVDPRRHGWRGHILHQLDKDGDGMLAASEIPAEFRTAMLAADRDRDGKIDFTEFDAAIASLPAPVESEPAPSKALMTPPPAGERVPIYVPKDSKSATAKVPDWFVKRDTDRDGQVGLYEWPANELDRFKKLDSNHDGFLTRDEAAAEK